jgi:hypothetical protein
MFISIIFDETELSLLRGQPYFYKFGLSTDKNIGIEKHENKQTL